MTSSALIEEMKSNADQIESSLSFLKSQVDLLKANIVDNVDCSQRSKLQARNNALRLEIKQTKMALALAEIKNGIHQVLQPQHSSGSVAGSPVTDSTSPVSGAPRSPEDKLMKAGSHDTEAASLQSQASTESTLVATGEKQEAGRSRCDDRMDVSRLDLRVGKITWVEKHKDADKLYVETVDVGEDKRRTIVSGLVDHVDISDMEGRLAVFLCNLKSSKMRGVLSEGMIMCAKLGNVVEILQPPPGAVPGDRVCCEEYPGNPDKLLNPKRKVWETLKPHVRTNTRGVASYKGAPLRVTDKGVITAPSLRDAEVS